MSDEERTSTTAMLDLALARLEAADAYERLVRAALDHHQPIGWLIHGIALLADYGPDALPDGLEAAELNGLVRLYRDGRLDLDLVRGRSAPQDDPRTDLVVVARRFGATVDATAEGARMEVASTETALAELLAHVLDLAVDAPGRRLTLGRYGSRAWLCLRGTAVSVPHGRGMDHDGTVRAARAAVVLGGGGNSAVADCWLPLVE